MSLLSRIGFLAATVALLSAASPGGEANAAGRTNRVAIEYVTPKDPAHVPIHDLIRSKRLLERLQEFMSPLRLPRRLTLKVEGCDGVENAWYEDDAVTVCYEYLDYVQRTAPADIPAAGITRADYLAGMVVDVFLHELGHAVFDLLKIPVFGREEDAADQFSAYIQLQFPKDEARRLIGGVVMGYAVELKLRSAGDIAKGEATATLRSYADAHGASAQRFFNILCLAYGADPVTFAVVVERGILPEGRAEGCELEYKQVAYAWRTLIAPHLDRKLARKVMAQRWLPEVKDRPAPPPRAPTPARTQ